MSADNSIMNISGRRDMTVKLTEVAERRFVDNVTAITPGALNGGSWQWRRIRSSSKSSPPTEGWPVPVRSAGAQSA